MKRLFGFGWILETIMRFIIPQKLFVLIGTHTCATSYSGAIEYPTARILIDADSTTALATVTAPKLSVTQSTPKKTGTLIPELTFAQLADIAGYIDGVYYEMTAEFRIKFSIPISLGGAYDMKGGQLAYNITGATAADTIKVYSIDDARRDEDYIEIVPVACNAGGVKVVDMINVAFLFVDLTNVTRIKLNYNGGLSVEYVGEELQEIARVVNPVHKVTNAGLVTAGYGTLAGVNVVDALSAEINLTAAGIVYVCKHLSA